MGDRLGTPGAVVIFLFVVLGRPVAVLVLFLEGGRAPVANALVAGALVPEALVCEALVVREVLVAKAFVAKALVTKELGKFLDLQPSHVCCQI